MLVFRHEEEKDYREVENLMREAFWNVYRPGCYEHYLAHKMRNDEAYMPTLSFVAEEGGKIVAAVMFAKATVEAEDRTYTIPVLGPVAVLPERQGERIGFELIKYALFLAWERGIPLVALTGSPEYYKRFGFESASKHGIFYDGLPKDEESPFFMVKIIHKEASEDIKGIYKEPKIYFVDKDEVEEFDKSFPEKVKEKREGQLE